jgi:hypothetical protein
VPDLRTDLDDLAREATTGLPRLPVDRVRAAGDRRRRRRYTGTAAAVALGLAVVVGGTTALWPDAGPSTVPAGPTPTTESTGAPAPTTAPTDPATEPATPSTDPSTTGPDATAAAPPGYGRVKIGMTVEEALATGEVTEGQGGDPDLADCTHLDLAGDGDVIANPGEPARIVAIFFGPGMRTSAGVQEGDTLEQVLAAYPGSVLVPEPNRTVSVPVRDDVSYVFWINPEGVVDEIQLSSDRQTCFG